MKTQLPRVTGGLVAICFAFLFGLCGFEGAVGQPRTAPPARPQRDSTTTDTLEVRDRAPRPHPSRSGVTGWGGGSIHPGGVIGTMPAGWFGLVGLRYHRLLVPPAGEALARHDAPTLTYTADAIPIAAVVIPKGTPPRTPSFAIQSVAETGLTTVGMGVYPIGLRVGFRPSAVLRPFVAGHTGVFYFFKSVPDERGRHLNFAAGVGGGVKIALAHRTVLTLGYRYHHLSNGFRASINPGLDANLLYVGIELAP